MSDYGNTNLPLEKGSSLTSPLQSFQEWIEFARAAGQIRLLGRGQIQLQRNSPGLRIISGDRGLLIGLEDNQWAPYLPWKSIELDHRSLVLKLISDAINRSDASSSISLAFQVNTPEAAQISDMTRIGLHRYYEHKGQLVAYESKPIKVISVLQLHSPGCELKNQMSKRTGG